jgi:anti-sigma factor RsiW
MTCRELVGFIDAYLSNELPSSERVCFEQHLAKCDACVDYLDSYRSTVAMGKLAFAKHDSSEIPDEVPHDLIEAILASRKKLG